MSYFACDHQNVLIIVVRIVTGMLYWFSSKKGSCCVCTHIEIRSTSQLGGNGNGTALRKRAFQCHRCHRSWCLGCVQERHDTWLSSDGMVWNCDDCNNEGTIINFTDTNKFYLAWGRNSTDVRPVRLVLSNGDKFRLPTKYLIDSTTVFDGMWNVCAILWIEKNALSMLTV